MKLFEVLMLPPEYLFEMTKSTGEFSITPATQAAITQHYQEIQQHGKHIGNIGAYPIIEDRYSGTSRVALQYIETVVDPNTQHQVKKNRGPVAFCLFKQVNYNNTDYIGLILAHSLSADFPQLRGKNFISVLLTFMRGHYSKPIIDHSGYQSDEFIGALKSLASKSELNVQWLNIKTGQTEKYDPAKDHPETSPYRSKTQKTDWRITMESAGTHEIGDFQSHDEMLKVITKGLRQRKRFNE